LQVPSALRSNDADPMPEKYAPLYKLSYPRTPCDA
jgi:hypothetical protein